MLLKRKDEGLLAALNRIGVEAVNWARENGNYTDRTTNLRNSVNYAIFKDSKLLHDNGNLTSEQISLISNELEKVNGYTLVIYAGMYYGIYVEARGYTVLSGALEASETSKLLMEALGNAVRRL
jgi:hypothetical protein